MRSWFCRVRAARHAARCGVYHTFITRSSTETVNTPEATGDDPSLRVCLLYFLFFCDSSLCSTEMAEASSVHNGTVPRLRNHRVPERGLITGRYRECSSREAYTSWVVKINTCHEAEHKTYFKQGYCFITFDLSSLSPYVKLIPIDIMKHNKPT